MLATSLFLEYVIVVRITQNIRQHELLCDFNQNDIHSLGESSEEGKLVTVSIRQFLLMQRIRFWVQPFYEAPGDLWVNLEYMQWLTLAEPKCALVSGRNKVDIGPSKKLIKIIVLPWPLKQHLCMLTHSPTFSHCANPQFSYWFWIYTCNLVSDDQNIIQSLYLIIKMVYI